MNFKFPILIAREICASRPYLLRIYLLFRHFERMENLLVAFILMFFFFCVYHAITMELIKIYHFLFNLFFDLNYGRIEGEL